MGAGNAVHFDNPQALVTAVLLASGQSSASARQKNTQHKGVKIWINISAVAGGATVTVTIRGYDPVSGSTVTILASAALNSTGETVLTVYPGLPSSANVSADDIMPPSWDVNAVVAVGGTASFTIAQSMLA